MSSEIRWLILKRAEVTFQDENCAMCWLNPQGFLFMETCGFMESHVGFIHEEHAQSACDDCALMKTSVSPFYLPLSPVRSTTKQQTFFVVVLYFQYLRTVFSNEIKFHITSLGKFLVKKRNPRQIGKAAYFSLLPQFFFRSLSFSQK